MTIKEAEERTGLARSNIRFYEKEGLFCPERNPQNGYREYTEENIEDIRKIAYLRTLGISIETIRKIIHHEAELAEVVREQEQILNRQISDMEKAKEICRQIALDETVEYDTLRIEDYTADVQKYWRDNEKLFRLDSATFVSAWGGTAVWAVITLLCLAAAVFMYPHLPEQIPVQYHNGEVSSEAKKIFIFAYPAALCNNPADFKSLHPGQADGSGSGTAAPGSDNRLSQQQSVFYRIVCGDFFNPVFIWICKKYCAACYSRRGSFNGYITVRNQKTKISSCIT